MPDIQSKGVGKPRPSFSQQVAAAETRKIEARRNPTPGVWVGLGMVGIIGWSVTVPTLLCVALGIWLDHHYPGKHGWTLALLVVGLAVGCLNAWHWVALEVESMRDPREKADE